MPGRFSYSKAAVERAMKVQEVMLRAWAKKITWCQAAEILGISDRHLRRIREGYEKFGYFSLLDKRAGPALAQARAGGGGGEGAGLVWGEVFRFERAAFSREVTRAACHPSQLQLGEVGPTRGGAGSLPTPARGASQAPGAASLARHVVAHRREPSSVVPGRTLV